MRCFIILSALRRMRSVTAAVCVAALSAAGLAHGENCGLTILAEMPMESSEVNSPIVSIKINDQPRKVLVDTGGFWSMLAPQTAAGFLSRRSQVGLYLGLDAIPLDTLVTAPNIQVGPIKVEKVDFFVSPPGYGAFEGTLGANLLRSFDVDIDPVANKISFFSQKHCPGQVVYWPHQDLAEIPLDIDQFGKLITIPLTLDGKQVRALIDTGSPETFLSLAAAERLFGLKPDSPGMQRADFAADAHGKIKQAYRYQFRSLDLGEIAFKNPWLTLTPMVTRGTDMIIGMHQLHALHLYFAYDEKKLYASTARGDIAARQPAGAGGGAATASAPDPLDKTNARDLLGVAAADLQKNDKDAAAKAIESALKLDPSLAQAYVMRSFLRAAQKQFDLAFADANESIRLDPNNAEAYVQRAQLYLATRNLNGALADSDKAVALNPRSARTYLLRAMLHAGLKQNSDALRDMTAAVSLEPSNVGFYIFRGELYEQENTPSLAFDDADKAVHLQPKNPVALNARCWYGAILGRLPSALSDCDAAIALQPRNEAILDSRGFVHLKMGVLNLALDDYNAALAVNPKLASSLYGRGLVRQQKGDTKGAAADVAAARAIAPDIADRFGK
jgi:tetratricopeptide (TPR) repeat protein